MCYTQGLRLGSFLSMKNFHVTLFPTLHTNYKDYRDWILPAGMGVIGKSAVIKYHQFLSKVKSIKRKLCFDQSATASSCHSHCCAMKLLVKSMVHVTACVNLHSSFFAASRTLILMLPVALVVLEMLHTISCFWMHYVKNRNTPNFLDHS